MKRINDKHKIRNTEIKNRICVPPMHMSFVSDEDGFINDKAIEHYMNFAKGGAGLIIQEATCIHPQGKLSLRQIGIWKDEHIEGLKRITEAVHKEGCPIVVQLHHAGLMAVNEEVVCPSYYEKSSKKVKELTKEEIESLIQDFIDAGQRAYLAGYDGVELHGCHDYLMSQFLCSKVNKRDDEYKDGLNFVYPIIKGIREKTSDDFIIGIRLGGFEPTLQDGINHAVRLADNGIDFIDVSYGFRPEMEVTCPKEWKLKDIIYAASEIKKNVHIPVFAVNGINNPKLANDVLRVSDVDMVDVGRSHIVDYQWSNKALNGEIPGRCCQCMRCVIGKTPEKCPGRMLLKRNK